MGIDMLNVPKSSSVKECRMQRHSAHFISAVEMEFNVWNSFLLKVDQSRHRGLFANKKVISDFLGQCLGVLEAHILVNA